MHSTGESDLLRLIGLAYDTALAGRDWTDVLKELATCANGHSAMLRMADYSKRNIRFFDTYGYSPDLPESYRKHFIEIDPYRNGFETGPVGRLMTVDEYLGRENRRRGAFYNLYERPNGAEYTIGAALARNDSFTLHAGVHRGPNVGDFEPATRKFLSQALPHLARAAAMREILRAASARQLIMQSALERLTVGVAVTDSQARLLYVNRAGEQFLNASHGSLHVHLGCLKAREPKDATRLSRFIGEASSTTAGRGFFAGGEMSLRCRDGSFLQICVTPLSRQRLDFEFAAPLACAAVFMCRPGGIHLSARKVALLYGLTPAEARLAVRLAGGKDPKRAADELGVSLHTVRTQLKAIFAKTGCRRQSELVAALLQGILPVCRTGEEG